MILQSPGQIVGFGGVRDVETDDTLSPSFSNDLFGYSLEKEHWYHVRLKHGEDVRQYQKEKEDSRLELAQTAIRERREAKKSKQKSIQLGDQEGDEVAQQSVSRTSPPQGESRIPEGCWPSPRMKVGLVMKGKTLFLYGGIYEEKNRQRHFGDLYSVDLGKMDEWKCWIASPQDDWRGESSSDSSPTSDDEDEA